MHPEFLLASRADQHLEIGYSRPVRAHHAHSGSQDKSPHFVEKRQSHQDPLNHSPSPAPPAPVGPEKWCCDNERLFRIAAIAQIHPYEPRAMPVTLHRALPKTDGYHPNLPRIRLLSHSSRRAHCIVQFGTANRVDCDFERRFLHTGESETSFESDSRST